MDGAHNPHGIEATSNSLKRHFRDKKIVFLIGVMADKDVGGMVGFITPLAQAFVTVKPNNPRAMKLRSSRKSYLFTKTCNGLRFYPGGRCRSNTAGRGGRSRLCASSLIFPEISAKP